MRIIQLTQVVVKEEGVIAAIGRRQCNCKLDIFLHVLHHKLKKIQLTHILHEAITHYLVFSNYFTSKYSNQLSPPRVMV